MLQMMVHIMSSNCAGSGSANGLIRPDKKAFNIWTIVLYFCIDFLTCEFWLEVVDVEGAGVLVEV